VDFRSHYDDGAIDMNVSTWFSVLSRAAYGRQRWIYLPYAGIFTCLLLLGILTEQETRGLVPYGISIPVLLFQFRRPTIAGWVAALLAWEPFCFYIVLADYRNVRSGIDSVSIWLVLGFALLSSAPLYVFRPHLRDIRPYGLPTD
jgi:hypothetical protein